MQIRCMLLGIFLIGSSAQLVSMREEAAPQKSIFQTMWQAITTQGERLVTFVKDTWNGWWRYLTAYRAAQQVRQRQASAPKASASAQPAASPVVTQPTVSVPAFVQLVETPSALPQPARVTQSEPYVPTSTLSDYITPAMSSLLVIQNKTAKSIVVGYQIPGRASIERELSAGKERIRWLDLSLLSLYVRLEGAVRPGEKHALRNIIKEFQESLIRNGVGLIVIEDRKITLGFFTRFTYSDEDFKRYVDALVSFINREALKILDVDQSLYNVLNRHVESLKKAWGKKDEFSKVLQTIANDMHSRASNYGGSFAILKLFASIVAKIGFVQNYIETARPLAARMAAPLSTLHASMSLAEPVQKLVMQPAVQLYPEYNKVWAQVALPEEYQDIVVKYAQKNAGHEFIPTLDQAMDDVVKARELVWGAIVDHIGLTLMNDFGGVQKPMAWAMDSLYPPQVLRGQRTLKNLGSISFKDFDSASDPEEKKQVMRDLVADYKVHFMPSGDPTQIIIALCQLINKTPQLQQDIWALKFNKRYNDEQLRKVGSGSPEAKPKIVIYPASGKEPAQRVLDTLYVHFKDKPGLGIAPRFNEQVTDLIYVAQGNGDEKKGNYLQYFKAPAYVYFDEDKVAQVLGVDPAMLNFKLTIPR